MNWNPPADLTWGAKQLVLADYFERYPRPVVIETGAWNGYGSCLQFHDRAKVYVIESDPAHAEAARKHEPEQWRVIEGDSATKLPFLLKSIGVPAFFWLDAHLVAEAEEENHSPLMAELDAILAWEHAAESVILIDDVRMMGREGWPHISEVAIANGFVRGTWQWEEKDDIVRLTPW